MSTQEPDAKRRRVEQSDDMICEEDGPESTVIKPFPDPSQYKMKKRTPQHGPKIQPNDIYLSRKSNLTSIYARAKKIFQHNLYNGECHIHALGSAIPLAVEISLQLQQEFPLVLSPKTDTVKLVDDFIPKNGIGEAFSQIRYNSAIHILLKLDAQVKKKTKKEASGGDFGDDFISL